MKSSELREKYLAFFESKGCKRFPSSSLIPDDPSLLLTSAGMVQFKPYFLQQKQLEKPYVGATTVQKCVRTTDIDIIGTTGRHLSFFEMLGNFSFGEYFKTEMCAWAYEFSTEVLKFDPERLYYTVYLDDDETVEIWKNLGVPAERIRRLGDEDNFWRAGATGPCGPCSELYYDQGPSFGCDSPDCGPGCDCDRFIEYWNLVFTQFDAQEDGSFSPLPKKNIDTGLGLERTAALLQGVQSNYETDILRGLITVAERLSGLTYGGSFSHSEDLKGTVKPSEESARNDLGMRILADHTRAVTFMIADGILPSNEGRGYVLRRLLRRAMRYGQLINIETPFLGEFVAAVIAEMGSVYPEVLEHRGLIERIVQSEEERFSQTLRQGQVYLDQSLDLLKSTSASQLDGVTAFELHDRFGFPLDLTIEIAGEQGVTVDTEGFEEHMTIQRERARAHAKGDAWLTSSGIYCTLLEEYGATEFVGYTQNEVSAQVIAIIIDDESVSSIQEGQAAQIVLDRTPFYAERGGQLGDTGVLVLTESTGDLNPITFMVADTKIYENAVYAHTGHVNGSLSVGDMVVARIDAVRRARIERNHTATHLLHFALQQILGEHIKQAGSLVAPDRLRFDFTHFEPLTHKQLQEAEALVNTLILEDKNTVSYETSLDEAREKGVTALFGEKYEDQVRVIEVGSGSRELCGGTHVDHASMIGFMKILSESSVGANLRRIEAVTGIDALHEVNRLEDTLLSAATLLKTNPFEVTEKIESLQKRTRELEATLKENRAACVADDVDTLLEEALDVGYSLVIARLDGRDAEALRATADQIRDRFSPQATGVAVVFGSVTPSGTPLLMAAGSKEAVAFGFDAGAVIKRIASAIKGGGGGKATMAQAGGKYAEGIDAALQSARELLANDASLFVDAVSLRR